MPEIIIINGKPNSCEGCHYHLDDLCCTLEEDVSAAATKYMWSKKMFLCSNCYDEQLHFYSKRPLSKVGSCDNCGKFKYVERAYKKQLELINENLQQEIQDNSLQEI